MCAVLPAFNLLLVLVFSSVHVVLLFPPLPHTPVSRYTLLVISSYDNKQIRADGGVVIYLQQEGRGIGLANKVAAYALQDQGLDTVDANRHLGFGDDERTYDIVPSILRDLGVKYVNINVS